MRIMTGRSRLRNFLERVRASSVAKRIRERPSDAEQRCNEGYCGDRSTNTFTAQRQRARKRRHGKYIHRHRCANGAAWPWNPKRGLDPATGSSNEHCHASRQSKSLREKFYSAKKCTPVPKELEGLSEVNFASRRMAGSRTRPRRCSWS
jgi:hypothetical protein